MRALALLIPVALAACVPAAEPMGRALYAERCAACHGPTGAGDGPAAAGLDPAPPSLRTLAARNGGTFPRAHVMDVIDGYAKGERAMPAFGDEDLGDTIVVELEPGVGTPVPENLLALADYLATLQDQGAAPNHMTNGDG